MKCVTSESDTFTQYGSNITNVWREILTPMTFWYSLAKLYTKNYENPSIFVKVTAKNRWHLFYVDTMYSYSAKSKKYRRTKKVAIGQWDWANVTGKLSIGVVNLYNYDDNVCLFHLLMSFLSLIHGWLKKTTTGHIHVRCWCVYTQVKSRKGYQGCLSSLEVVGEKKSLLEPGITRIPPEYTESIRQGCIGQTFCILTKKQQQ